MSPRSEEYHKRLDTIVNALNIGLIILAGFLISFGTYYAIQTEYSYLVSTGIILIICGVLAIIAGGWGFWKHYKMVKKMKKQAQLDLNY